MDQALIDLGDSLLSALPDHLREPVVAHGELSVRCDAPSLIKSLIFLRDNTDTRFKQLIDICVVDYPDREPRFEVVYHLLSHRHNQRIRLKLRTDADSPVPGKDHDEEGWYFSWTPQELRAVLGRVAGAMRTLRAAELFVENLALTALSDEIADLPAPLPLTLPLPLSLPLPLPLPCPCEI